MRIIWYQEKRPWKRVANIQLQQVPQQIQELSQRENGSPENSLAGVRIRKTDTQRAQDRAPFRQAHHQGSFPCVRTARERASAQEGECGGRLPLLWWTHQRNKLVCLRHSWPNTQRKSLVAVCRDRINFPVPRRQEVLGRTWVRDCFGDRRWIWWPEDCFFWHSLPDVPSAHGEDCDTRNDQETGNGSRQGLACHGQEFAHDRWINILEKIDLVLPEVSKLSGWANCSPPIRREELDTRESAPGSPESPNIQTVSLHLWIWSQNIQDD